MADPRSFAVGANSFMQGFSFVDDIYSRKRQEAKLDERLEEEKKARAFAREVGKEALIDRGIARKNNALDRQRDEQDRADSIAGKRLALDPNASIEDLIAAAGNSPEAYAAAQKKIGTNALVKAMMDLPSPAQQPTQPLGLAAAAATTPEEEAAAIKRDTLVAPSQGRSSIQSVDVDSIEDPRAPGKFAFGDKLAETFDGAGNRIGGLVSGVAQAAGNVIVGGLNMATGQNAPPLQAATGIVAAEEVGGQLALPEAYVDESEIAQMEGDPMQMEAAVQTNAKIIEDLTQRGIEIHGSDELSRLDNLRLGSREARAKAAEAEHQVKNYYDGVDSTTKSHPWRSLAKDNPQAAAIKYFSDRATLKSADPAQAAQMDIMAQPVIREANAQISKTLSNSVVGTPEQLRATRDLRRLHASQKDLYNEYSPAIQAGIDARGMPIGNAQLSNQVTQVAVDPNRPRPMDQFSGRQVATAITQTNRMAGTKRGTEAQIRAGILLYDAKLVSAQDLTTLNMTGKWPMGGSIPKLTAYKPGDYVYAQDQTTGNMTLAFQVPGGTATRGGKNGGLTPGELNQVTPELLAQFNRGMDVYYPSGVDGNDEMRNEMTKLLISGADVIQDTFDMRDPLAGMRLAESFSYAAGLADAEDSGWVWDPIERLLGDRPSLEEVMSSPKIAAELAGQHGLPMPKVQPPRVEGLFMNNLREELATPRKYPASLNQMAIDPNVSDEQLVNEVARFEYLRNLAPAAP